MKNLTLIASIFAFSTCCNAQSFQTFHDYSGKTILGDSIDFTMYYGKKVMVVNTASYCAYTHQYTDLEQLYTGYHQYNFEIIGFPCNDFGNQEPGYDSTIFDFCQTYNVTFQMMSKIATVSADTAPVYKWLQRADLNGVADAPVAWNFNKFLIDEAGHWVRHYGSPTNPLDTAITNWIMSPSAISGIDDKPVLSNLSVFPNPANEVVTVSYQLEQSELVSISLTDITGRLLFSQIQEANSGLIKSSIDLKDNKLSPGLYSLNIKISEQNFNRKLVIVR